MTTDGIRYTHPNPAEIGGQLPGHDRACAARRVVHRDVHRHARAVGARRGAGRVDGQVARASSRSGQSVNRVSQELSRQLPLLLGTTVVALLLAGARLLAGQPVAAAQRRTTSGPAELSRMYEYYDAVLHAVREGLLLLDRDGRLRLVNDEAGRLLGVSDAVARPPGRRDRAPAGARRGAAGRGRAGDEIFLTDDRIVVVNQAAARWAGPDGWARW